MAFALPLLLSLLHFSSCVAYQWECEELQLLQVHKADAGISKVASPCATTTTSTTTGDKYKALEARVERLEDAEAKQNDTLESHDTQLESQNQSLETLNTLVASQNKSLEALSREVDAQNQTIDALKTQVSNLTNDLANLDRQVDVQNKSLEDLEERLSSLESMNVQTAWTSVFFSESNETRTSSATNGNLDQAMSIGPDGNIFITGSVVTDDARTLAFLRKIDNATGRVIWTQFLGWPPANKTAGASVSVAADGSIFVAGHTEVDLNGQIVSGGVSDGFVMKLNENGTALWTVLINAIAGGVSANSVAVNNQGDVYISGIAYGSSIGGITLPAPLNTFVTKLNGLGVVQWTRVADSTNTSLGLGLCVDPTGDVFVSGLAIGDINNQTKSGAADAFLWKLDGNGTFIWTKLFGDYIASGTSVSAREGSVVLAGHALPNNSTSNDQAFLIKLGTDGSSQWNTTLASLPQHELSGVGASGVKAYSVTIADSGSVYMAGETEGNLGSQVKTGFKDGFVSKFGADGTLMWTKLVGSETLSRVDIASVRVASDGAVFVAGNMDGSSLNDDTALVNGEWAYGLGTVHVTKLLEM